MKGAPHAEARAAAIALRVSAKACEPEQGALRFRLVRAAESLDAIVLIAARGIERIEELEKPVAANSLTIAEGPDLNAEDCEVLLIVLDLYERGLKEEVLRAGNNIEQSPTLHRRSRALIVRAKVQGNAGGAMITSKTESQAYYKALGAHIAELRKARGMTQAELARAIGVSQQAVFAYEVSERRVSLYILIKLAKVFSTPVDELAGIARPVRVPKRRLSPRAMRHAERMQALSKTQQRFVVRILDMLEASNRASHEITALTRSWSLA